MTLKPETTDNPTVIEDPFERSGYEAGYAGLQPSQATEWNDAFDAVGSNILAYVLAGWVAGRAVRTLEGLSHVE